MSTRPITLLLPLLFTPSWIRAEDLNPEALFRKSLTKWRFQKDDYGPWLDFRTELLERFEKGPPSGRLELVGGLEESILMIEKSTLHEGENVDRDMALSRLYEAYGYTLFKLGPQECLDLAKDPHTVLIGSETAKEPSTRLCVENAENALRNAAVLDATNADAQELLAKITGDEETVHKRKPREFVAELFDSFADSFDEKLGHLQYKVPQYVGETARGLGKEQYRAILDAGCGTGLAGRFLLPLKSQVMIGVDASQKMLDVAQKCTTTSGCGLSTEATQTDETPQPLYEGLLMMDLEEMTLDNTLFQFVSNESSVSAFDLIVAADVLVYFGSLVHLFQVFGTISVPGAGLVFSCERATLEEAPMGWRLLPSGRFAHTKQHAVDAASAVGYELVSYQEIVPRMEKGEEVRGHLFGFVLKEERQIKEEL